MKPEPITRESVADNTAALDAIIRPLGTAKYEIDASFRDLDGMLATYVRDWGGLDMNPDFQRGHVWSPDQQQHYIENVLRGVVSSSGFVIQFNCANWENDGYDPVTGDLPRGFHCIDGLQRVTAVRKFLAGDVKPFGLDVSELDNSSFSMKRGRFQFRLAVHTFEHRADLLAHYLDLNEGGTPHSNEEMARVRAMLNQANQAKVAGAPDEKKSAKKARP